MNKDFTLLVRRMGFWLCVAALGVGSAAIWWYYVAIKLEQTITPTIIVNETNWGEAAVLFIALFCSFLPAAMLFTGQPLHRASIEQRFSVQMQQIAWAYDQVHKTDRAGVFALKGEFDAMQERLEWAASNPDLAGLETPALVVAAQMSVQSSELAAAFSDEKVEQVVAFLKQRHVDIARQKEIIDQAKAFTVWARANTDQIETEQAVVNSDWHRVEEELAELLGPLGWQAPTRGNSNVQSIRPTK